MASFTSWFFGDRCEFCGTIISEQKVYTARSEVIAATGPNVSAVTEPSLYDCVDCPKCGRQHVIGRRFRNETDN